MEQIVACYADVFMFGGPEGVQCVKKEDFLKVLPRRKEFFRSLGLVCSNIHSLEGSTLDSKKRSFWGAVERPAETIQGLKAEFSALWALVVGKASTSATTGQ